MDGSSDHHRWRTTSLGLVFLVILVIGFADSEDVCRSGCKQASPHTYKYNLGTTYKYNYEGKIDISLSSAEGQTTSTSVKADVLLTQLPECNQLIRLQNVVIAGGNGKKHASIPDIDKPIRINNNDGLVDDSICVVDGDNQNSINVKRAIASIFQAISKTGYETDVFGRCPTDVATHKEGDVLVIQKTRALNKCAFREHIQHDFISTALNLNSEIKSSPILHGDYSANLRIKNGILDQATVTEDYLFVPFSVGKNGAKAQVVSKLHLSGSSQESPEVTCSKPRSIIFENPHPVVAPGSNVQTIQNAVKEVAKTIDIVVGENTAREFINLLKIVRVSNKNDLLAVYNQVKSGVGVGDKEAAKRVYLDALLRAGNGDTVEALLELLNKKQLDETDTKLVLLGLNVVRHATEGSIKAATSLLNTPSLPREAYLGIGNLAGKFCHQHDCSDNAEIKTLTAKLLTKIGGKPTNREQENDAVFALKALANFHHLNENVIPKLTGLAQNKNIPNRVRVAALETYLADPCKDKLRNSALQILQDIQQDSEVRIKAYLAVAQCPNAKIGNAIKALLVKEPSIQVGGFIASHLHALRASANSDKAVAKQFLGFSVRRNFPIDPRKYSFNGEFSYAIDTLGYGASAEANVIYSQNSWLPRSSSLNLTAEIFGHRFNSLEIETRQENLDRLVEHYFGPKGVLRNSLSSTIKEGKTKFGNLAQYVEEKLKATLSRNRRDVSKAEIDHIAKQVQIKTNELNKDLDLDLGVKAFGSEIFFLNINQEAKVKPEIIIDRIIQELSKGLDKLQSFEETLRRNINFLDTELGYPTSLGFPLRLAVEGSAAVQVKAQGNIDVRKLLNHPEKGEIKITLIPSSNIEVSGKLTVDALVVENGLKVISTLYSSTGGDLTASWDRSSGFDVKFGLPVPEQKIISANHEIVFVSKEQSGRENNVPLKFTQVKDFSICLDQLSPFIGLTFCAEINGPNLEGQQIPILPFPLAGDAKIAITIENDDVSEYRIRQNTKEGHADLVFETIGKNGQKKVALDLSAEYSPEKYIRAVFNSPQKEASAEARIVLTNVEKSLLLKLTHDKDEFVGKLGVAVSGTPERTIYKPILEYKTPQGLMALPMKTEGQIIVEQNGENIKIIFDNVKVLSEQYEVGLQGSAGKDAGIWFTDFSLSPGQGANIKFEGRLQLTGELVKFNIKMENTINSNANFNFKGELKQQLHNCDVAIQLIHGPDLNSKTAILTITSKVVKKFKSSSDFRFETKQSIKYPLLGISGKFELEHTPSAIDYEVEVEYGDLKLGSELEAKVNEKNRGDYQVEFDLWGLDNKLEVKSSRQVLPNDQSKISNAVELNGKKLKIDGTITHAIRPHFLNVGTDLIIHAPGQAGPIKVSTGLKLAEDELDSHAKISSGSDSIIDSFLKADKKGNANGSLKLTVKNLVSVNGQVHSNNGAGNGEVVVDLQNGKRQFKADTTFNIQPAKKYDISVNVYPNSQDKSSKISFSTHSNVDENSIESKNKLDVFGHPLEVNAKASRTETGDQRNMNSELEITLPGEQYLQAKSNVECKGLNDLYTGHVLSSVEYRKNKNTPGRKYSCKGSWKDSNLKEGIISAEINLAADDSNGKNINNDISIKASKGDEGRRTFGLLSKVYGSVLKDALELRVATNCINSLMCDYDVLTKYGSTNSFLIKGAHDLSKPKRDGFLMIELGTENEHLKSFIVSLKGSVTKPEDSSAPVQVEGEVSVDAANAKGSLVSLKSSSQVEVGPLSGKVKGSATLNQMEPISVDASYNIKEKHLGGSANALVTYGKGQSIKSEVSLDRTSDHQYKLVGGLDTVTAEGPKSNKIIVNTKRSQGGNEVVSSVELLVDGKAWKLNSEIGLNEISPVVNLKLVGPEGKLRQIYLKGNKVSARQFGGELKLVNEEKSFLLDGDISVNVENIENLIVKGQINSPNLSLNKIVFEASNKAGAADRKLNVNIKSAGKNYLSGDLSYAAKEENGKFIIDGSGDFKVKDQSKSGNFKYILEKLENAKNGEQGVQVSFDASLGDKAIDSEYKLTNKHFRLQNSYCEKTKECAYIEIENKINANDATNFNQVLEISLDLRKLGLSHEFGLKATTNRKEWVVDHTVDAHFQNNANSKYQYSFYIHPTEAGVSLATPKRIVALEAHSRTLKNNEGGKSTGELAFFIDKKNHPNKKTALSWSLEVITSGKINGQMKFNHPGLKKALSSSFHATRSGTPYNGQIDIESVLDIFAQDDQKLVYAYHKSVKLDNTKTKGSSKITFELKSSGLGVDIRGSEIISGDRISKELTYNSEVKYRVGSTKYDNSVSSKWSPKEISGQVKVLNQVLIDASHKIRVSGNEQVIESKVSSYDNNPIVSRLEIKNYNTLAYSLGLEKQPDKKLLFNAGLIPDQIADIRADIQDGGNKQNLFFATVKLDDANFLKSDHKVDSKAIQNVLEKVRERSGKFLEGLEQLGEKWIQEGKKEAEELKVIAKKAAPNLQPLKQYYTKELQELKEEILNDKGVKELSDAIRKVLGTVISVTAEWFEKLSQFAEESAKILEESFRGVIESIERELLPQLKSIASNLLKDAKTILNIVLDMSLNILGKASEILEKYQPELQDLAATFRELFQDVGKLIHRIYNNGLESARQLIQRISNEIKSSPAIEEIKAQYELFIKEGIPSADAIVNTIREVFDTIKDVIPNEFVIKDDINRLLDSITDYVEKKLKSQPVDDVAAFEEIAKVLANILKKLANIIRADTIQLPGTSVDSSSLLPLSYLNNLPRLVAVKFSPISFLLEQDSPAEVGKFLLSLLNDPVDLIPPFPLHGLIIQGQHIFTFDGKHITFPGKCNYLLARDAVNGNFTLAGTYKDGLLASITLGDNHGNSITLQQGGKVKVNQEASELPIRKQSLAAWRNYETVTLLSTAGITVECVPDLQGCTVKISGFYHGQIRGLLGNGNAEPYDDFTLPNGKIVTAEGQFGNGYKLSSSCPDVTTPKHESVPENPTCNKLFSYESSLRLCFPFVPTENFKAACAHGLAANVKGTEEAIAKAYVAACQMRNVPIHVPENLVKCTNSEKPFSVGDTFSVKLPSKSADIVVIVDSEKSNQKLYDKLVKQLIPEITSELNAKGVRDVEFHLITYGGLNQWPTHITVGGKLSFKGKAPALKFGEEQKPEYDIKDIQHPGIQKLAGDIKEALHEIDLASGLNLKSRTYDVAYKYPFRANALKSIIVINGDECEVGKLYPLQKLFAYIYKNNQITLNLFTPFSTLKLKDAKKAKDIIGFNSQNVFTLSQGKKNPKGTSELHKELNYEDYCVDFTVNQNRGNAFVNNNFLSLNEGDQKQYVKIAATNIAEQLINVEQGLDCECKMVNPWSAVNVCKEAFSRERPTKKV